MGPDTQVPELQDFRAFNMLMYSVLTQIIGFKGHLLIVTFCSCGIGMKLNGNFAAPFLPTPGRWKELLWGELNKINLPA